MLGLAVGDRSLARHRIVVARLALALFIRAVSGLADERDLVFAELLGLEPALGIVVMVEVSKAYIQ